MEFQWIKSDDESNASLTSAETSPVAARRPLGPAGTTGRVSAAVVAALACAALAHAAAPTASGALPRGFRIGPLILGMTNADVVKVRPLQNCMSRVATMECVVELTSLGEKRSVDLSFDIATKKLRKIELCTTRISSVDRGRLNWDDPRMPQFFTDLGIEPCPPAMEQKQATYRPVVKCFSSSQQVREIGIRGYAAKNFQAPADDLYILIKREPTAYRAFMKQKAELAAMERAAATNEARERAFSQGK